MLLKDRLSKFTKKELMDYARTFGIVVPAVRGRNTSVAVD